MSKKLSSKYVALVMIFVIGALGGFVLYTSFAASTDNPSQIGSVEEVPSAAIKSIEQANDAVTQKLQEELSNN